MRKIKFVIGLVLALLGAILMVEGSAFGVRTIGIAIILGMVGICLISSSSSNSIKKWC